MTPNPYDAVRRYWLPRDSRPMQEWCDEHLYLSPKYANMGGPWSTRVFPHQRGIMAMLALPGVREIDMCFGTRLGKTVLLKAFTAWASKNDPGPAMLAAADREDVLKWFKEEYLMLADCHETADLLRPEKDRRFPEMDLSDMLLFGAWSGSPMTMGGRSIKYLLCTEYDKWSKDKSAEGGAEFIVRERVKDWPNHKIICESTPSIEGASNIENALRDADVVLEYHVPCPICGKYQILDMGTEDGTFGVKWAHNEKGESDSTLARETAYYRCAHCQGEMRDEHRGPMLRRGIWAPSDYHLPTDAPDSALYYLGRRNVKRIGLRLSSLYSPPPFTSWGIIAEEFLRAKRGGIRGLQNFHNGWLARSYQHAVDRPEWRQVRDRLTDPLPRGVVPAWCAYLTAGIDCHSPTQRGNIYAVVASGPGGRTHIVEVGEVRGELRNSVADQIHMSVETVLGASWLTEDNESRLIDLACIDSGGTWTHDVYQETIRAGKRLRAIKGAAGANAMQKPWEPRHATVDPRTGKPYPSGGLSYFLLNSNFWKSFVVGKLSEMERSGSSMTLHSGMDDVVLQQICNVYLHQELDKRGLMKSEFRVSDIVVSDHAHDALCYALAAADMMPGHVLFQRAVIEHPKIKPKPDAEPRRGRFNFGKRSGFVRRR